MLLVARGARDLFSFSMPFFRDYVNKPEEKELIVMPIRYDTKGHCFFLRFYHGVLNTGLIHSEITELLSQRPKSK
jgi:hypothetical protein